MSGALPFLVFCRIYTCLLQASSFSLETKYAINKCVKCIIITASYIDTGMDLGTTLTIKNITGLYELAVCSFCS